MKTVYFISHPEIVMNPHVPVTQWPLSDVGIMRMRQMLKQPWINAITAIYCSTEQKAMDGARILANHLGVGCAIHEGIGEVDRSSTGFLPPPEFEKAVDQLFGHPEKSFRGWETAVAAQQRIVNAIDEVIRNDMSRGNIALVSHGGVGALYLSYLQDIPISRDADQPGTGGGNYFSFEAESRQLLTQWLPIDQDSANP
ncbi:phosphoglycerate mutase family protein [Chloroflexi bacterium TSY]|nr:phosphoglycerate mutase family protein [Chloroflexi bacterium TSY]